MGDYVLCKIGEILRWNLREIDIISRYGGEEFCIILPETDIRGASVLEEKIRKKIEEERFLNQKESKITNLTVSIGIATYKDGIGAINLIERADEALYMSKQSGRNRVALYNG